MPRITCQVPSPDKPIVVRTAVTTSYTTLLEAPDFDVPAPPDSLTPRTVLPGMHEIITPIILANVTAATVTVDVRVLSQAGVATVVALQLPVPAYDVVKYPIQGQFLLKTDEAAANGDRLQIRASANASINAMISAIEKEASDHIPEPA